MVGRRASLQQLAHHVGLAGVRCVHERGGALLVDHVGIGAPLEQVGHEVGAAGVRVGTIDPHTVRLATHKDVDDDAITRVLAAFDSLRA